MNNALASDPIINAEFDKLILSPETDTNSTQPVNTEHRGTIRHPLTEKILEAYSIATTLATQISDSEYRAEIEEKLVKSGVRGSMVFGISGPDDVVVMLESVTDWQEVPANLKDEEITIFQGKLGARYRAMTAYASLDEIGREYGNDGLGTVRPRIGFHNDGEIYLCSVMQFDTDVITVHVKSVKDPMSKDFGLEKVDRWFPGIELASRLMRPGVQGDMIVRMNVKLPKLSQRQAKMPSGGYARGRKNYQKVS